MEVLLFDETESIFESDLFKVIEAHQVLRNIDWSILGHSVPAYCILQIEVKFEAVRTSRLGVGLLSELDRIEGVPKIQGRIAFSPHPRRNSLCIYRSSDEESPRFETTRRVVEECPQFRLSFEQIVHGELATHDVKHYLLLDVLHGLVRRQHMVY